MALYSGTTLWAASYILAAQVTAPRDPFAVIALVWYCALTLTPRSRLKVDAIATPVGPDYRSSPTAPVWLSLFPVTPFVAKHTASFELIPDVTAALAAAL